MNHPLIPLGDTPKDGDFARYLELLTPSLRSTSDGPPGPFAGQEARTWRLPEATRAALGVPATTSAGGGAQGAVRQAGARPTAATTVGSRPSPTALPGAGDAAWGSSAGAAGQPGRGSITTTVGSLTQVPAGPPDLAALLDPLRGLIGRALIAVGAVWFVLGGLLGIEPFQSSVGVAMFLIFGGIFLHRSRRRPPPEA